MRHGTRHGMMHGAMVVATLVAGLVGCHGQLDDEPRAASGPEGRGGVLRGKADGLEGRCQTGAQLFCGERSAGSCWCDELCSHYGDCCSDKADSCDLPATLRMADVMSPHANGYPIYYDSSTPELIGAPVRIEVSRPDLVVPRYAPHPLSLHALVDGRLMSVNTMLYIEPCDGLSPEQCNGPLELGLWSDNEPSVLLARRRVELMPTPPDALSAAPCMGVGNVARFDFRTGYLGHTGIGTMTAVNGKWLVGRISQSFGKPLWRILVSTQVKRGTGQSFDFAIPQDLPIGVPTEVQSMAGAGEGWVMYQGSCGRGRVVVHELELADGYVDEGNLARLTIAWELECGAFQGQQKVVKNLQGCIHYDSEQPVIMWE